MLPEKLCAHEADLGNRIVIGASLTDAQLEADGKSQGFDPCRGCDACVRACPAGAYGDDGSYHGVWSREKCEKTRQALRARGCSQCNLCWTLCPLGEYSHDELFILDVRRSEPLSRIARWVECARESVGVDPMPGKLSSLP
jgi:epoxyqueuosine reductase QueG